MTVRKAGDPTVLAAAASSPSEFISSLTTPAFIDEAQLLPELTLAVKRAVDRGAPAGSFILTGSSRLGRAQLGGSDPLAGRAVRVQLWPMTQGELIGIPPDRVGALLGGGALASSEPIDATQLLSRIVRGGLHTIAGVAGPVPGAVRASLIAEYVEGVLYHEVGGRHDRAELARLLRYLASTTSRTLNVNTVAREVGAARETVSSRLASLEASFLVHMVPAHRAHEHRTLTAHPKVHVIDTAIAGWAARIGDQRPAADVWGALVETFVVNELAAQAAWSYRAIEVRHWRNTAKKIEIDLLLIDATGQELAVEVKAAPDVRDDDLHGLRTYLAEQPHAQGVVFYTGGLVLPFGERIRAVPITALWSA